MLIKDPLSVVVLANKSLLAGGIAGRLKDDSHLFDVTLLETNDHDEMIAQLVGLNPGIALVDALDMHLLE
jgi:hypothetical protein